MDDKQSMLSWKKEDFERAGEEVPSKLKNDNFHTDGEIMGEEEIAEWLKDSRATFLILRQRDRNRYKQICDSFRLDIQYLVKIGKISEEEANVIMNDEYINQE